jgi:hypothetical protein
MLCQCIVSLSRHAKSQRLSAIPKNVHVLLDSQHMPQR